MPANPFKDQQKALSYLKKIFRNVPLQGLSKDMLLIEVLSSYAVSQQLVLKFIDLHIRENVIREEGGIIYAGRPK